jgi:hypothetical protein
MVSGTEGSGLLALAGYVGLSLEDDEEVIAAPLLAERTPRRIDREYHRRSEMSGRIPDVALAIRLRPAAFNPRLRAVLRGAEAG